MTALDLRSDPDPESLKRVTEVLDDLDATLPTAQDRRFDRTSGAGVIRRGGNVTADAIETELLGVPVRVCSLARLREMKEAQGRPEDKADLANLPESEK